MTPDRYGDDPAARLDALHAADDKADQLAELRRELEAEPCDPLPAPSEAVTAP